MFVRGAKRRGNKLGLRGEADSYRHSRGSGNLVISHKYNLPQLLRTYRVLAVLINNSG